MRRGLAGVSAQDRVLRDGGSPSEQARGHTSYSLYTVPMNSRDTIAAMVADGWFLDRVKGSHHQFRHPTKPGIVTVPHPKKDLKRGLVRSIERQAGIKISDP